MTTTGLIIVFAAVMCLIAMLAIGVDWIGKPIRNRKFVPRIYRYEDEADLVVRPAPPGSTPGWTAPAALPAATAVPLPLPPAGAVPFGAPMGAGVGMQAPQQLALPAAERPDIIHRGAQAGGSSTSFADLIALETFPTASPSPGVHLTTQPASAGELFTTTSGFDLDRDGDGDRDRDRDGDEENASQIFMIDPDDATLEPGIWQPGDPLWGPTATEQRADRTVAERRFWQTLLVTSPASQWLGTDNIRRMKNGQPPQRLNHFTGQTETMVVLRLEPPDAQFSTQAPSDAPTSYERAHAQWPGTDLDPFDR